LSLKRVAITGGTGFVGQRLVTALSQTQTSIRLLSRLSQPDFETVVCDLQSKIIPAGALIDIDIVFHLAGYAHDLRDATEIERLYRKVNVDSTIQLANLAVQNNVKQFVFVSSVKAGGSAVSGQCMTEDDHSEPEGIYGKTKREAELKLLEIGRNSDMNVSIVRPSLVYGPNVKGNLHLMLSGIEKGWFPPLPEVGNRRSMIHVDDLISALLLVADDDNATGNIYIATDGERYSSREIYEIMCAVLNKSVPRWSVPKFLFDIVASISSSLRYKMDKLLGDECYSSEKLESLGFKARRSLRDMNKTSF
jgi:UDP-glucose 4-epimerase